METSELQGPVVPREAGPDEDNAQQAIPPTLPILPITSFVVFPNAVGPISIQDERYVKMINDAAAKDRFIGVVLNRNKNADTPSEVDLCPVGTAARIIKLMNVSGGALSFICQGIARIRIDRLLQHDPYIAAEVSSFDEDGEASEEIDAMVSTLRNQFAHLVDISPQLSEQLKLVAVNLADVVKLIDFTAANCTPDVERQQEILETPNIKYRLKKTLSVVQAEIQKTELSNRIQQEIAQEINEQQREHLLRAQLKKIQAELGEKDEQQAEIENIRSDITGANLPEEAEKTALKEIDRLASMSPAAAEYPVVRTYLEWLACLPWSISTEDHLDIAAAQRVLDEDHYDLEKVKKRIVEYVAVRKLKNEMKGPILCFYGPPGVGKTSLGKSIARALDRKFVRISLGGVRDEAEIRGHRRTYVGALPGRIIQGLKKAGTNNPVFMLDEVDKLGMDFRGDPSSALLEVLDPEQNSTFSDHYLEVTFDLSRVFFITTANMLETIPPALRDRLEILELPGYTDAEKLHIAKKYLIGRQKEEHGLREGQIHIDDDALSAVIRNYTREAGVRNLEREIATLCRGVAKSIAEGTVTEAQVTPDDLAGMLGPSRHFSEVAERITVPGIATGLAWTPSGGDILFVEATRMPGGKNLTLTGQLGEVMKESAQTALSYVRSKSEDYGIDPGFYTSSDVHLHVPAGAIPKDGPSAGVTMVCALASLLTGRLVRSDTAMTGEITLRGKVMPVGGIKEKVLAAKRAGLHRVIMPRLNQKDLAETPDAVKSDMTFVFVDRIDEAVDDVLSGQKA